MIMNRSTTVLNSVTLSRTEILRTSLYYILLYINYRLQSRSMEMHPWQLINNSIVCTMVHPTFKILRTKSHTIQSSFRNPILQSKACIILRASERTKWCIALFFGPFFHFLPDFCLLEVVAVLSLA